MIFADYFSPSPFTNSAYFVQPPRRQYTLRPVYSQPAAFADCYNQSPVPTRSNNRRRRQHAKQCDCCADTKRSANYDNEYADDYGYYYNDAPRGWHDYEEQQRARQQQQLLNRQRQEAARRQQEAAAAVARQRQQQLLNTAASIIQRAFRRHLTDRQTAAALCIQTAFRRHLQYRRIHSQLQLVSSLNVQVDSLVKRNQSVFTSPLRVSPDRTRVEFGGDNVPFLRYENDLLKLMLAADGVQSYGSDAVRMRRKQLIAKLNALLVAVDAHKAYSLTAEEPATAEEPETAATEPMDCSCDSKDDEHADSGMDSDMESLGSTFEFLYNEE